MSVTRLGPCCSTMLLTCDECQRASELTTQSLVNLVTILLKKRIMKWGVDFIELIKLIGRFTNNKCILVSINYVIKWVEAKVFWINTTMVTTKFFYKYIFTRFGFPFILIID